jgi:predicted phosphodiesterase
MWTLEHTDQRSKDFMRRLPFDLRFELGGRRVRHVHGSPRKVNEYLFEDKPARTFERIAADADCDLLVFGHTHNGRQAQGTATPVRRRRAQEVRSAGLPPEYADRLVAAV